MNNSEIARQMVLAAVKALDLSCTISGHSVEITARGVDLARVAERLQGKFSVHAHYRQAKLHIEWIGASYPEIISLVGAIELAIAHAIRPRHVEFGTGLRAAQATYARLTSEARMATTV